MRHKPLTPDKYLLPHELQAVKARLSTLSPRDSLYFRVLIETGMRASEALNLEPRDLLGSGRIHVRTLKQGVPRTLTLEASTYADLEALCASGSMFPFTLRRADQLWRLLRPVTLLKSLHSVRHTVARDLYRATNDLRLVQYVLGHANITNTMIYLEVDTEDEIAKGLAKMRGAS